MSLGSVPGGWWHTVSSGAQSAAWMVSFMAVITLLRCPPWYTVSTRMVLATRPPMTTAAWYMGTAPGIQSLGAACQRGGVAG